MENSTHCDIWTFWKNRLANRADFPTYRLIEIQFLWSEIVLQVKIHLAGQRSCAKVTIYILHYKMIPDIPIQRIRLISSHLLYISSISRRRLNFIQL